MLETTFSAHWVRTGGVVYELTHDLAALFAMTSSPPLDWNEAPHSYFVVKVPRALLPVSATSIESTDTYLLVGRGGVLVVADCDTTAECCVTFGDVTPTPEKFSYPVMICDDNQIARTAATLAIRFTSNLIAYVSRYRERVQPKALSTPRARATMVVRTPCDVVITNEFRTAAYAAVASGSLVDVRRAMAHVVRGHWRNQHVGECRRDRKMTWVRPHRRGDESFGRVVSRVEKVGAA
jgi:hypothetical protein